jgi:hypothetical protein
MAMATKGGHMTNLMKIQDRINSREYLEAIELCGSSERVDDTYRKMYGYRTDDPELETLRDRNVLVVLKIEDKAKK